MSVVRTRSAVSPLRRQLDARPVRRPTVDQVIAADRPEEPVHCLRPAILSATAETFVTAFPGDVLYAVKCNPDPAVLRALHQGGVRHFDCASLNEVRLVRGMFPDAAIHFMHPIKARGAIREAWERHAVRTFVLDSAAELAKIRAEVAATGVPGRLNLVVRLALPKGDARLDLSGKFGAPVEQAVMLLQDARQDAAELGISFHVGSQCMDPLAWRTALDLTGRVSRAAGVKIDIVDVGGGFPVAYPDQEPPPLGAFLAEIEDGFDRLGLPRARLWAEPGRALVAGGASVVVQVQARRDDALYVNDGVYGSLSDAGT
ncbi:MAG TPA: type III PLP-dependent enzyme, partial [Rhodopila sp.]|nr:type III PLP-dependent enzyme [Rhodopila sp.]